LLLLSPPLALAFGIAGLLRDDRKLHAIVALLISGAFVGYFLIVSGLLSAMR
jgi:hypothetical protein